MLYVIVGNNYNAVRKELDVRVADLDTIVLTADTLDYEIIDNHIGSGGLFAEKKAIIIKDAFVLPDEKDTLFDRIPRMMTSGNIFIVVEESLLKKDYETFEKAGAKIIEHSVKESFQKDTTLFQLADFYRDRDKKNLWLGLRRSLVQGKSAEEIHGILWWQIKTLLAILSTKENPGLHPFVYNKNKSAVKNFSKQELLNDAQKLITIYHQARAGKGELEITLEQFVLGLFVSKIKQKVLQ